MISFREQKELIKTNVLACQADRLILIQGMNSVLDRNGELILTPIKIDGVIRILKEDSFYYTDRDGIFYQVDLAKKIKKSIFDFKFYPSSYDIVSNIIIGFNYENGNKNYFLVDVNLKKVVKIVNTLIDRCKLYKDKIIFSDEKELVLMESKPDFNVLFQFPIQQLGNTPFEDKQDKIKEIIGVTNGHVWFYTESGRLVALDEETGQVAKKFCTHEKDVAFGYEKTLLSRNIYLSEEDQNIYCMSSVYCKINTKDLKVEEVIDFENGYYQPLKRYSIRNSLLQGKYFTFIAADNLPGMASGEARHIGVFDCQAKELVWEHALFEKGSKDFIPSPQKVYLSGDRLFVSDFNNTLHIFEKE